jgi:hypothetical protein
MTRRYRTESDYDAIVEDGGHPSPLAHEEVSRALARLARAHRAIRRSRRASEAGTVTEEEK